MIIIIGPKTI